MRRSMVRPVLSHALLASLAAPLCAQGLPPVPVPPGNPITADKVNLGKALFWDEQLSSTRTMACGTCHVPATGGSDPRSRLPGSVHPGLDGRFGSPDDIVGSRGVIGNEADGSYAPAQSFGLADQVTNRKAPSAINAAINGQLLFWDGRATGAFTDPISGAVVLGNNAALESQAAAPPVSDVEMSFHGGDWNDVAARVAGARPLALASNLPPALASWIGSRDYDALFAQAFGSAGVTPSRILMAIATYERTLISDQAPIDAFLAGNPAALTPQEQRGFGVFRNEGRCAVCHTPPLFARLPGPGPQGEIFFNIGVRPIPEDLGRGAITGQPQHQGAFKIPSLRNVGLRAPYFHNGGKQNLGEVVDFYRRGGDFRQGQTPLIQPFNISPQQRGDLLAFLQNALTDPRVAQGLPPFDRPTLYSESNLVPRSYGFASPGTGGIPPRLIAVEPAVLGNPNLTIALGNGLGGAPAAMLIGANAAPPGASLLGAPLWVAPAGALFVPLGSLAGSGAGAGHASLMLAMPASSNLVGSPFFVQGFAADPAAPAGLVATQGASLTVFAPR